MFIFISAIKMEIVSHDTQCQFIYFGALPPDYGFNNVFDLHEILRFTYIFK